MSLDNRRPDIGLAARGWLRAPVLAAAAILTLALGIGAITAICRSSTACCCARSAYPKPDQLITDHAVHGLGPQAFGAQQNIIGQMVEINGLRREVSASCRRAQT
jgi:hypothetical protein